MKLTFFICLLITINIAILSCKKEESPKWLTGEVYIIDKESKTPLIANIDLEYYSKKKNTYMHSAKKEIRLGTTDENGYLKFEKHFRKTGSSSFFKLKININKDYNIDHYKYKDGPLNLDIRNHNILNLEAKRYYNMGVTLTNTSCYDETDSIWLSRPPHHSSGTRVYTGCLDNYIIIRADDKPRAVYVGTSKDITYRTISKKNGVYDTLYHEFILIHGETIEGELNQYEINY